MAASHTRRWQGGTVVGVSDVATRIRRIEIDVDEPVRVDAGAHVDVSIDVRGEPAERSYSIVDASDDGGRIALSVFESETSRGGAAVMHALTAGARIKVTRPINDFPLRFGARRYLLIAGGIGITAMAMMAARLKRAGADYRLAYLGRSRDAMAYLEELSDDHAGRIDVHVRDEGTSFLVDSAVAALEPGTEVYVCGPIRLMDAVRRAWIRHGRPPADLRAETFGNSGWFAAEEFTVRVPSLALETRVLPHQTMLEALEEAGADLLFDCRKGECGLCEVRVAQLEGVIDHRDVFYSERQRDAETKLCCCVSRIVTADGSATGVVTIIPT